MSGLFRWRNAILFGSRALEREHPGSDIDIAIKGNISAREIIELKLDYDELMLPYRIDIVSYDQISNPALKAHIDRVGQAIESEIFL